MNKEEFIKAQANKLYTRSLFTGPLKPDATYMDFEKLVRDVVDSVTLHPDFDVSEYRTDLFIKSGLTENIKGLVDQKKMTPGLVISYGTPLYTESISYGNQNETPVLNKMTTDSIIDLASVTKMFTSISILKLVELGIISLDDEIVKYCPKFVNLQNVTIFDLLSFGVPLCTDKRLDKEKSKDEAENILFNIRINENFKPNTNPYTDMGAMVLKYVVESATNMSFYDFINEQILTPLGMKDTFARVPEEKLGRTVSTDGDSKVLADGTVVTNTKSVGLPYDEKAFILESHEGRLTGHAGLFSTAADMTTLAKSILSGCVLKNTTLDEIAKNRTGSIYYTDDGVAHTVQYLGYLCYVKNPLLYNSEVAHILSNKAFSSPGWLGNQFVVDPENEIYSFMGSNRSHNRVVYVHPDMREKVEQKEGETTYISLPNGERKIDSSRYAWHKGEVADTALMLALQYKVLEEYLHLNELEETANRSI